MIKRIAYLAPFNSTSAEAAIQLGKRGYGFLECATPVELINSIDDDTYGVIPLEDCIDASEASSINALIDTAKDVFIVKKHLQVADYRIFVIKGVEYRDILKIKIPVHAYEMCRSNIQEIMPQAKLEFVSSTDRAIEELDSTTCAIAGVINNAKHLSMGGTSVTDIDAEATAFGLIKGELEITKEATVSMLSITALNIKGTLSKIIDVLDSHDIRIRSIRSHNIINESIRLIVEIEGNARAKHIKDAIDQLQSDQADVDTVASEDEYSYIDGQLTVSNTISQNDDEIDNIVGYDKRIKVRILGCY